MKLKKKELAIVGTVKIDRNVAQRKFLQKTWAVKIQLRSLRTCLQLIIPTDNYFQHEILDFLQIWIQSSSLLVADQRGARGPHPLEFFLVPSLAPTILESYKILNFGCIVYCKYSRPCNVYKE